MRHEEQRIQTAIVVAFRKRFDAFTYHCPNGGARTRLEALAFKDAGLTAGVPDLQSVGRHGRILYLEVKRPAEIKRAERDSAPTERFESLSDSQRLVVPELRARGFTVGVVCSVDEAVRVAEEFGFAPKREAPARSPEALATGF